MAQDACSKIEAIISEYRPRIDTSAVIPAAEYQRRWSAVQDELKKRGLDAGIFFYYREMAGDGIYLSGYNPTIERASGVIGQEGKPVVIAGPEAGEVAREAARVNEVEVLYAEEFQIPEEYYAGATFTALQSIISRAVGQKDAKKVGWLTSLDLVPVKLAETMRAAIGEGVEFVDASDILYELRYEKSEVELTMMAATDCIANATARAMLAAVRPGMRESELAAIGDYVMKTLGATSYGFETIVNSGPRCRTVIGPASNRVIQDGEIVQIGVSPGFVDYKGVCRRVFFMGEPSELQAKYIEHLEIGFSKAKDTMKKVVAEGGSPNVIDLAARDYFATVDLAGVSMGDLMCYSPVHGTGLTECLEGKVASPFTTEPLGDRIGIMLDIGAYGHPDDSIAGGCIEDAFAKDGTKLMEFTDLPANVQNLVGC